MKPIFITVVDADGQSEADLWNPRDGNVWHVTWLDGSRPGGMLAVDDMPDHWIEQLRRWAILGKKLERRLM